MTSPFDKDKPQNENGLIDNTPKTTTPFEEDGGFYDTGNIIGIFENVTASAESIPNGTEATAEYIEETFDFHFGIPIGDQGEIGPEGPQGPEGQAVGKWLPNTDYLIDATVFTTDNNNMYRSLFNFTSGATFNEANWQELAEDLPFIAGSGANTLARWNGTTGELVKDSSVTLADDGTMFGVYDIITESGISLANYVINSTATGLIIGGEIFTESPTTFGVGIGKARFVDATDPINSSSIEIEFGPFTGLVPDNLLDFGAWVGVKADGNITIQSDEFTTEDLRTTILIGFVSHNAGLINYVTERKILIPNGPLNVVDLAISIGSINVSGNRYAPITATRSMEKNSGKIFQIGSNPSVINDPNVTSQSSNIEVSFYRTWGDSVNGFFSDPIAQLYNCTEWWSVATGQIETVNLNNWCVHQIYLSPTDNVTIIVVGQNEYNNYDDAVAGLSEGLDVDPVLLSNTILRGYLIARGGALDFANLNDANIIDAGKFGGASSGPTAPSSPTDLQGAYDNSANPEITLDTINGAFGIRDSLTGVTNELYEIQDFARGIYYFAVDATRILTEVNLALDNGLSPTILDAQSLINQNATDLTDHINTLINAHVASAISYDNSATTLLADNVQDAIDELASIVIADPSGIGKIETYGMETLPDSHLLCDGSEVAQATYPELYALIGEKFGVAVDPVLNFLVPNLMGRFTRGYSLDAVNDPEGPRAVGAYQADSFASHVHTAFQVVNGQAGAEELISRGLFTGNAPTDLMGASGGAETRPRNIAVAYAIRHRSEQKQLVIDIEYPPIEIYKSTDFEAYIPITQGADLTGNLYWKRDGQNIVIHGEVTVANPTADIFAISLPPDLVQDNTLISSSNVVGTATISDPTIKRLLSLVGASGNLVFSNQDSGNSGLTPLLGDSLFIGGETFNFNYSCPIVGWTHADDGVIFEDNDVSGIGKVETFGTEVAPFGYLLCDGSNLLRADYPDLFAVIGTRFGTDTVDDFRTPDMRGQFVRGWANGSTQDPDSLTRVIWNAGGSVGDAVGSYQADQNLAHSHTLVNNNILSSGSNGGPHSPYVAGNGDSTNVSSNGGTDARPRNIYLAYFIRYLGEAKTIVASIPELTQDIPHNVCQIEVDPTQYTTSAVGTTTATVQNLDRLKGDTEFITLDPTLNEFVLEAGDYVLEVPVGANNGAQYVHCDLFDVVAGVFEERAEYVAYSDVNATTTFNTVSFIINLTEPKKYSIRLFSDVEALGSIWIGRMTITKQISEAILSGGLSGPIDAIDVSYDNSTSGLTATEVQSAIDELASNPSSQSAVVVNDLGRVETFAYDAVPSNYKICNGESLLRAEYTDLFNLIGTAFGTADGNTFNIPDLQGRFIRGVDNGALNDPDSLTRVESHLGGNVGDLIGSLQADAIENHDHRSDYGVALGQIDGTISRGANHDGSFDYSSNVVGASFSTETRPKNVYLVYAIKAVLDTSTAIPETDNTGIGRIDSFGTDTNPAGYLSCNGSEVLITEYQELFDVIGLSFGVPVDPLNFLLPNLLGNFLRGSSLDNLVDPEGPRLAGSNQLSETGAHTHTSPAHSHTSAPHDHSATTIAANTTGGTASFGGGTGGGSATAYVGATASIIDATASVIDASTGLETRPVNVAVGYFIKYQGDAKNIIQKTDDVVTPYTITESVTYTGAMSLSVEGFVQLRYDIQNESSEVVHVDNNLFTKYTLLQDANITAISGYTGTASVQFQTRISNSEGSVLHLVNAFSSSTGGAEASPLIYSAKKGDYVTFWSTTASDDNANTTFSITATAHSVGTIKESAISYDDIVLQGSGNAGEAVAVNVAIPFIATEDSHGAWDGTIFTVPEDGIYDISGVVRGSASIGDLQVDVYKNGTKLQAVQYNVGLQQIYPFSSAYPLKKDNTITVASNKAITLLNDPTTHFISITKQAKVVPTVIVENPKGKFETTFKGLTADVATDNTDLTDLTFTGLEEGALYLLSGQIIIAYFDNNQNEVRFRSASDGGGVQYGAMGGYTDGGTIIRPTGAVCQIITAKSSELYVRHHGTKPVYSSGTPTNRDGTFLELTKFPTQLGIVTAETVEVQAPATTGDMKTSMLTPAQLATKEGEGWLLCDGQTCVGTEYEALTTYTTVPNMLGQFTRGLDLSGTIDPDGLTRILGSQQPDALASHTHNLTYVGSGGAEYNALSNATAGVGTVDNRFCSAPVGVTTDIESRPKNVAVNHYIYVN